jgi:hypothetical protein
VKEPLFELSLLPRAISARERTYHRQSGSNSQLLLTGRLIERFRSIYVFGKLPYNRRFGDVAGSHPEREGDSASSEIENTSADSISVCRHFTRSASDVAQRPSFLPTEESFSQLPTMISADTAVRQPTIPQSDRVELGGL